MKALLITLISPLLITTGFCQDTLIENFIKVNEVYDEVVGPGASSSVQFERFLRFSKNYSTEELIGLIEHEHVVVKTYASWALVDHNYDKIDSVFLLFNKLDQKVRIYTGCLKTSLPITSALYSYINDHRIEKTNNQILQKIDSVIIYNKIHPSHLLKQALSNRLYPSRYIAKIESLAFENQNLYALNYLSIWYKGTYRNRLITTMNSIWNEETEFEVNQFYLMCEILLSLDDDNSTTMVIEKLNASNSWKLRSDEFYTLMKNYKIFGMVWNKNH